jgi:acetylornithine aminotransferase
VKAIDDDLLANVAGRSAELVAGLAGLSGVVAGRGRGLLLGIEVADSANEIVDAARESGLLVLAAGEHVVRLAPPLTVSAGEVSEALVTLSRILC